MLGNKSNPRQVESDLLFNGIVLAAIWYLTMPSPALAYFDLGFGTYMLQLIFGFGAAFALAAKSSLKRKWNQWLNRNNKQDAAELVSEEAAGK